MAELANESEPDANSQQEPTIESLQTQIEQKEQDMKHLKDSFSAQKQDWIAEQKTQSDKVSNLEGRFEERDRQNAEPPVNPYELSEEQRDEFADNPSLMTGFIKDRVDESVDVIVSALRERDAMYKEQLTDMTGSMNQRFDSVDPEKQQWKEAITSLKENDAFSKLDDSTLIAIAKEKDMKPSMEYRGSAGGQRTRDTSTSHEPTKFSKELPMYGILMKMHDGDEKVAESVWNRMEATKANQGVK